jgi:hypothetical protein
MVDAEGASVGLRGSRPGQFLQQRFQTITLDRLSEIHPMFHFRQTFGERVQSGFHRHLLSPPRRHDDRDTPYVTWCENSFAEQRCRMLDEPALQVRATRAVCIAPTLGRLIEPRVAPGTAVDDQNDEPEQGQCSSSSTAGHQRCHLGGRQAGPHESTPSSSLRLFHRHLPASRRETPAVPEFVAVETRQLQKPESRAVTEPLHFG